MANHKSAAKRYRQNEKRRLNNRNVAVTMRSAIRKARAAVDEKNEEAAALIKAAVSAIDSAVTKGAVARNTASRYVSRLVRRGA